IVNGSELGEPVDLVYYLVGDHASLVKYLRALNYSVSYRGNLGHRVYYLSVSCGENLYKLLKSLGVGGKIAVRLIVVAGSGNLVRDMSAYPYTIAVALCDDRL